ncbi:MAG: hypothetical protein JSR60_18560 [Proteobacteria bacterium]|nr:hypothetical protein [Pseudomonadota bacterium]
MSKSKTQPKLPGRKPTHRLYRVIGEGDAASWTPIGAAWDHKDGHGFSLSCDAVPLQGRIVMRVVTERTAAAGGQQ